MSDFETSDDSEPSTLSDVDSNSELENLLEERIRPKNQNFFEVIIPQFNRKEFIEHFRASPAVANLIAERFEASEYYKSQAGPYGKLTSLQHTYIFLWYAGHQTSSYRDVADRFCICISALFKVLKKMTYFLSNLAYEVINWPNAEEKLEIEHFFRQRNGFPGIIGLIDGTHIKIDKPGEDPESYINRKGYYSIQAQLVCDHKLKIRDIFIGYPGSVHDARVFRTSPLCESLLEKCQNYHLLGDSAYPLSSNLLTPFPDRGLLTGQQINYNIKHSSNRIRIEHCNGVLKQKWRQLYHLKLRKMSNIVNFIRACCVLHNLCLEDEDNKEDYEDPNNIPQNAEDPYNIPQHAGDPEYDIQEDLNGIEKRNFIVNNLANN